MAHTYHNQFLHVVCITKNLENYISEDLKESLFAYITGIVKTLGCQFISRGGTYNHIHFLVNIPTTLSVYGLLCQLKACSSKWLRNQIPNQHNFSWSEGYFAFTVSPESIENVKQYFSSEMQRHNLLSTKNELIDFLKIHELNFNEQYLINTTYIRLIYHLVWSTKNREPLIEKSIQDSLHELIRNEAQEMKVKINAIGNVADHIHLLIECPSKVTTADLVSRLKTSTTNLIRSQSNSSDFQWQEGFGVFSVGKLALQAVMAYVNNQERHHQNYSYESELKNFLEKVNTFYMSPLRG